MKQNLTYDAKDFFLYLFSLMAFAGMTFWIVPHNSVRMIVVAGMSWLAVSFILRHGCKADLASFKLILMGSLRYPFQLLKEMSHTFKAGIPAFLTYAIAIGLEMWLQPHFQGSFLFAKFPWEVVFFTSMMIIELYRFMILIAHLRKSEHIQNILQDSPFRSQLKGLPARFHIFHAYITGVMTYFSSMLPCYLFWSLTSPTVIREIALFILFPVLSGFFIRKFGRQFNPMIGMFYLFGRRHGDEHEDRFLFAVFHGHHHDAMPSALIGGSNAGLMEAFHRGSVRYPFLYSTVFWMMISRLIFALEDIVVHQYIPGVYPFSQYVVFAKAHHMTHHYLSKLPLSVGGFADGPFIQFDLDQGYNLNNPKVKWYVDTVRKYEKVPEEQLFGFSQRLANENAEDFVKKNMGFGYCLKAMLGKDLWATRENQALKKSG